MMMNNNRALITGGAGFIGSNLAARLIESGVEVVVFDNLSRPGSHANLEWLRRLYGSSSFRFVQAPLVDYPALAAAARGSDRIYHLAGQVAVTTSVANPRVDFESNALGTFNMLEAARSAKSDPVVIYASTNKVYGEIQGAAIVEEESRYRYSDLPYGVNEDQLLDFHSPYGCSKGAGDQYVRDYHRIYGLRTVVVRQSCIYGQRQLGVEDQGWLAWFIAAALKGLPIQICGNGKQVRDALYVEDLLSAYEGIVENIESTAGQIYNIGGGPENTISIWREFGPLLEELFGRRLNPVFADWRPGDQKIYVSDVRKAQRDFGWRPTTSVLEGTALLYDWIRNNQDLFAFLERKRTAAHVKSIADRIQSATA